MRTKLTNFSSSVASAISLQKTRHLTLCLYILLFSLLSSSLKSWFSPFSFLSYNANRRGPAFIVFFLIVLRLLTQTLEILEIATILWPDRQIYSYILYIQRKREENIFKFRKLVSGEVRFVPRTCIHLLLCTLRCVSSLSGSLHFNEEKHRSKKFIWDLIYS